MQNKKVIQTTHEVSLRDMLQNPRVDLHRRIVTVKRTLWFWEAHGEYDDREQSCPHISCYSCFQPERCELKPDWSDSTSGKSTSVCPWAATREKFLDVWVGKTHTHIHTTQCCERCLRVALIALSPVTLWQLTTLSRISLKHFWNKVFISQYLTPRLYNNSSSALKHVRFKAASIFLWTSLNSLHFMPGSWECNAEIWEILRGIFAAVLEWAIGAYTGNHPDIIINPLIFTKNSSI